MITKKDVAEKMSAWFHREMTLDQLVDWAENAMMDGEFDEGDAPVIAAAVSRLGLADVRDFGLTWEDCQDILKNLGFFARVYIEAA